MRPESGPAAISGGGWTSNPQEWKPLAHHFAVSILLSPLLFFQHLTLAALRLLQSCIMTQARSAAIAPATLVRTGTASTCQCDRPVAHASLSTVLFKEANESADQSLIIRRRHLQ